MCRALSDPAAGPLPCCGLLAFRRSVMCLSASLPLCLSASLRPFSASSLLLSCSFRVGPPPPVGLPPDCCLVASARLRSAGPSPFGLPVRFSSGPSAPFRLPALRGIPGSDAGYEPLLLPGLPRVGKTRLRHFGGCNFWAAAIVRRLRRGPPRATPLSGGGEA